MAFLSSFLFCLLLLHQPKPKLIMTLLIGNQLQTQIYSRMEIINYTDEIATISNLTTNSHIKLLHMHQALNITSKQHNHE